MNDRLSTLSRWLTIIHTTLIILDKCVCFLQTVVPDGVASESGIS